MEKDLKDKKTGGKKYSEDTLDQAGPCSCCDCGACVFSGIKAKGSDGETEAVGQAETTVMSASELEKYFGYEKENTVSDSTAEKKQYNKKRKSSSKKKFKKNEKKC